MVQLLIRKLDSSLMRKLRAKAAAEGISAEEAARQILHRSLDDAPKTSLIDFLRTMPDAGNNLFFKRPKKQTT